MTAVQSRKQREKMVKLAHIVKNNAKNQVYILQKHNSKWDDVTAIVGVYQNEAEAIKDKESLIRHSSSDYRFFITIRILRE